MRQTHGRRQQAGFTLVDAAVTIGVVSVALGAAVPGIEGARARHHLEGVAAQIETELQHARAHAVASNRTVRFAVAEDAAGSCYVVHTGAAGDCTCTAGGTTACQGEGQALRSVHFDGQAPVRVTSNSRSMAFSSDFGTVTPTGTLEVRDRRGRAIRLVVNIMGRVRSCAPTPGSVAQPAC